MQRLDADRMNEKAKDKAEYQQTDSKHHASHTELPVTVASSVCKKKTIEEIKC